MRTYLILKDKAKRWNADPDIQALLAALEVPSQASPVVGSYKDAEVQALKAHKFDRTVMGERELGYERLDQLTLEILLGVR